MFDIFKEVSKYLNGGNVSVDGGRDGDWLEDKYGNGGGVYHEEKIGDIIICQQVS